MVEPAQPPVPRFVGRERELALGRAALAAATDGAGSVLLLRGPPGIGKTSLMLALAREAASGGMLVCQGRSYAEAGAPALWPWIEVLQAALRAAPAAATERTAAAVRNLEQALDTDLAGDRGRAHAAAQAQRNGSPVGLAVHALQAHRGSNPRTADAPGLPIFDAIVDVLCEMSRLQALLVTIDDLHVADTASLRVLELCTRRAGAASILGVGTLRTHVPSGRAAARAQLARLQSSPTVQVIELPSLRADELAPLLPSWWPHGDDDADLQHLHDATGGNPLFVTETLRRMDAVVRASPAPVDSPDLRRLGAQSVSDLLARRIEQLPPHCFTVLQCVALLGRETTTAELAAIVTSRTDPEEHLQPALDALLDDGLLLPTATATGLRCAHDLVAEAALAALPVTSRSRLHARIVEALEAQHGQYAPAHVAELAHHCAHAEALIGARTTARYAQLAGEQAMARLAYEDAHDHYQRALELLGDDAADARMGAMLYGLARSVQFRHAPDTADKDATVTGLMQRAFDRFRADGDLEQMVTVALSHRGPSRLYPELASQRRWLRDQFADDEATPPAIQLRAAVAEDEFLTDVDLHRARTTLFALRSRAQHVADRASEVFVVQLLVRCAVTARDFNLAERSIQEVLPLAVEYRPLSQAVLHFAQARIEVARAQIDAALESFQRLMSGMSGHAGRSQYLWAARAEARLHVLRGDWAAVALIDQRLFGHFGELYPNSVLTDIQELAYLRGDPAAGRESVARLERIAASGALTLWATLLAKASYCAFACPEAGDLRAIARTALAADTAKPAYRLLADASMAWLALLDGDADESARLYHAIAPHSGTMLGELLVMPFCADRMLGLLALATGDAATALRHLATARRLCRRGDLRLELAWVELARGQALAAHDEPGDVRRARAALRPSAELAAELGLQPLLQQAQDALAALSRRRPEGELTARERQVVAAVADGLSNKQIAGALGISVKTVEVHVRNAFDKTGSGNRAQLVRYALTEGVVTASG